MKILCKSIIDLNKQRYVIIKDDIENKKWKCYNYYEVNQMRRGLESVKPLDADVEKDGAKELKYDKDSYDY